MLDHIIHSRYGYPARPNADLCLRTICKVEGYPRLGEITTLQNRDKRHQQRRHKRVSFGSEWTRPASQQACASSHDQERSTKAT